MKKLRIYLDTSVIGGCFDDEFSEESRKLINEIKNNDKKGVISDITLREMMEAPQEIIQYFHTFKETLEIVQITTEADDLSEEYLRAKIIGVKFKNDSLHIAAATISQVDVLVSWNFKHIVNYNKIIQFNSVNIRNGFKPLQIFSPKEVLSYDK